MAFGIALWIRDTALRLRQQGIELSKKSLGYYGKVSHNRDNSSAITPGTAWSWKIGNNNEDLTWLI
jgi:hypothetical protein